MVVRKAERRPVPKGQLPSFTPVPRKQPRHDGWTPERQKAFIEALADTGCVAIACRMVNMSQPSFYYLRRQPGAESFRAAADAAQTLGLQPVKDEAFDRAINGELIPVFVAGKLMGFRRKKNDRLLMFILRHYGEDGQGRKVTVNYFSTRATAGAAAAQNPPRNGEGDHSLQANGGGAGSAAAGAAAESSTTTVKTVITGNPGQSTTLVRGNDAATLINAFEGVPLDPEAQAEIRRTLEACAERRRALEADPEHDPERLFIGEEETNGYLGQLESGIEGDWIEYRPDADPEQGLGREHRWESLGEGGQAAEIDRVVAEMQSRLAAESPQDRAAREAAQDAMSREAYAKANLPLPGYLGGQHPALPAPDPDPDDPRLDWRNWQSGTYTPPEPNQSSPATAGEGDHAEHGGGADALASEQLPAPTPIPEPPAPSPGAPKRTYKKRTPKPRFEPVTVEAGDAEYEALKVEATEKVESERSAAASAEAVRRKARARLY